MIVDDDYRAKQKNPTNPGGWWGATSEEFHLGLSKSSTSPFLQGRSKPVFGLSSGDYSLNVQSKRLCKSWGSIEVFCGAIRSSSRTQSVPTYPKYRVIVVELLPQLATFEYPLLSVMLLPPITYVPSCRGLTTTLCVGVFSSIQMISTDIKIAANATPARNRFTLKV